MLLKSSGAFLIVGGTSVASSPSFPHSSLLGRHSQSTSPATFHFFNTAWGGRIPLCLRKCFHQVVPLITFPLITFPFLSLQWQSRQTLSRQDLAFGTDLFIFTTDLFEAVENKRFRDNIRVKNGVRYQKYTSNCSKMRDFCQIFRIAE